MERLRERLNRYLVEHPRARVSTAERTLRAKIAQGKLEAWLAAEAEGRSLTLPVNQPALEEVSRLDGGYVLQTDLPASAAPARVIHGRYQDRAEVEQAFRTCKTAHREARPIEVRREEHTRAPVLLASRIRRHPSQAWAALEITVEEGLNLKTAVRTFA